MNINSRIREILEASPFLTYPQVGGGDPNRGRAGRAVPALPRGVDPYGSGLPSRGKLGARIAGLSDAERKRYYREIGMRSRVASRGGVTGRLYATEGAVKDALADYLYSIPQAAIEELRPVMKTKSLQKRFRDINTVLKRHGFTADFMGSRPANVVNDYYETFFG